MEVLNIFVRRAIYRFFFRRSIGGDLARDFDLEQQFIKYQETVICSINQNLTYNYIVILFQTLGISVILNIGTYCVLKKENLSSRAPTGWGEVSRNYIIWHIDISLYGMCITCIHISNT